MTIFFGIWTIIVDSIDSFSLRRKSHIGIEVFKLHPTVTYCYASFAISKEAFVFWIRAAINHLAPSTIYPSFAHAMSSGLVSNCTSIREKTFSASARSSLSASKFAAIYNAFLSAFTTTMPSGSIMRIASGAYLKERSQLSKYFARFDWRHVLLCQDKLENATLGVS